MCSFADKGGIVLFLLGMPLEDYIQTLSTVVSQSNLIGRLRFYPHFYLFVETVA